MNKLEVIKTEKDGLDSFPDLLRHAAADTPIDQIPEAVLQRMKWYGVFHRPQAPGTFMRRLRLTGGRLESGQLRAIASVARHYGHESVDLTTRQSIQLRTLKLRDIPAILLELGSGGVSTLQNCLGQCRRVPQARRLNKQPQAQPSRAKRKEELHFEAPPVASVEPS